MIKFFRTLQPINIILLIVYAIFMRLAIFYHLPNQLTTIYLEPYADQIFHLSSLQLSPFSNIVIALFIVIIQALLFNFIVNKHNLLPKASYLPALMYVTGSSLFLPYLTLSPTLLCNFIVIVVLSKLLDLSKTSNAIPLVYDIGLLIAIGSLIYFPFTLYLIMIWLSLMLYRPFSGREWVSGIMGFLTIYLFVAVYYYWYNILPSFMDIWNPLTNNFAEILKINFNDYLTLIPLFILLILAFLNIREHFFKTFISTRKAYQVLFFFLLISLASYYTKPIAGIDHFLLCTTSGSVLLAFYFTTAKKVWLYETLFAIWVLSIQYSLFV